MQATRQKIVDLLKKRRQATVEELADAVGLTPMAVRHHLNILQGENLVAKPYVRHKHQPGRPQQLYSLTEAADDLFPENYFRLICYLLEEIKASLGPSGLNELLSSLAQRMAAGAPQPGSNQLPEEHLEQLVQLLGDNGFIAQWEANGNGYNITMLSCPYRQVAREHNELCGLDMQIIQNLLNIEPSRVTCIAMGDERCTYHIRQSIQLSANG